MILRRVAMLDFLQRFNPFFFPKDSWAHKKYITLNCFKGYSFFDFHYWKPQDRSFLDGGIENSQRIMMFGVTVFYFRMELFFHWDHKGRSWKK